MTNGRPELGLVLLPGMDGTPHLFGPLLAALPATLRNTVVTYPPVGRNGYADVQPHVDAAVAATGPCIVLGWSFGGPLALRAANTRPDLVRGVVLVASFVLPPQRWLRWTGPLLCSPLVLAMRVLRRLPLWLGKPKHDPLRQAKARIWREVPARTLAARARAIRHVDARADLAALRVPLLYLAGNADRVVPPHALATIRALHPQVEVAMLRGGHFALFAAAADGARALAGFQQRVRNGG
jgi:pimeloyl-[acyl-carrier protein] methyl ester esterase